MNLTPEQFNKISTKEDIKESVKESEERMTKKLDEILTAVDGMTKTFEDHETEHTANQGAHDRMQKNINSNSKRINNLELKTV